MAKRHQQAGASGTGWICGACSLQEELQQLDIMELVRPSWLQMSVNLMRLFHDETSWEAQWHCSVFVNAWSVHV